MKQNLNARGQTLIEIIVTIAVIVGLMSLLITYNRTGQRIQSLGRVAEKAVFDIRKAQNYTLAVREFPPGSGEIPCGYGLNFVVGSNSYTIFADRASDCSAANGVMDAGEEVEVIKMEEGIVIHAANISTVVFRPPSADTFFVPPGVSLGIVTFSIGGNPSFTRSVTINRLGRIQVENPTFSPPPKDEKVWEKIGDKTGDTGDKDEKTGDKFTEKSDDKEAGDFKDEKSGDKAGDKAGDKSGDDKSGDINPEFI
jgi:hypothetical protein